MDYCTSDDIEIQIGKNSLVQLTNDDNTQQTVDSVVVEEALIYSSTLIDGYLRGKYNLPLNTQFPLLRVIAIDICIYRLYSRRIYTDMPETISENYKNAIRTLEQLKKGVITLETSENTEVKTSGEYRTNKTELDRLFNKRMINFEY
jgi:phage gp36-like protein